MSRLTIAVDRLAAVLVALTLLVLGLGAAVWGTDRLPPFTGALALAGVADAATKTWWPWTVGIGGAVAVLLGLRWLFAHVPQRRSGPLKLSGTDRTGRLIADGGSAVNAAADEFADTPGVGSARGSVITDRGQIVARLSAVIDPDADLAAVAAAADRTSAQLRHVMGRDDLTCRVHLRLARRTQPARRVQ